MIDLVKKHSAEEYVGVKELSDAAELLLREVGPSQERGTVAEYPNERTIRYYLSQGLIPPPYEKRGLTSVFGYPHLLTLLVIKKLQAKGLSISIIRTVIPGKSVAELENLLDEEITIFTDRQSLEEYRRMNEPGEEVLEINDTSGRADFIASQKPRPSFNEARSYLETLLLKKPINEESDIAFSMDFDEISAARRTPSAPEPIAEPKPSSWQRHEIAPGLELNISANFDRPAGYKQKRHLLKKIRQILGI